MADCVVALLDAEPAAAVGRLWDELQARWGLPRPHGDEPPHLTLAVLRGEYDPTRMHWVLEAVAAARSPFRTTSAGYGLFIGHGPSRPVVLHLPLTRSPRLSALHEDVVHRVSSLGLDVEGQYQPEHWRPHVTLADLGPSSELVGEVIAWLVSEGPRHTTVWVENLALVTAVGVDVHVTLDGED